MRFNKNLTLAIAAGLMAAATYAGPFLEIDLDNPATNSATGTSSVFVPPEKKPLMYSEILARCSSTNTPAQMHAVSSDWIDAYCHGTLLRTEGHAEFERRLMTNVVECVLATNRYDFFSQIGEATDMLATIYAYFDLFNDREAMEYCFSALPLYRNDKPLPRISDDDWRDALAIDAEEWEKKHGRKPGRPIRGTNYWNIVRAIHAGSSRDKKISEAREDLIDFAGYRLWGKFKSMDALDKDNFATNLVERFGFDERDLKLLLRNANK